MPVERERELQARARRVIKKKSDIHGPYKTIAQARNAYVYGELRREGWKPNQPRRDE